MENLTYQYAHVPVGELANADRDTTLMAWQEAKTHLDFWKSRESDLRALAFQKAVPNPKPGTNNIDLGNGYILKAVNTINYNVALEVDGVDVDDALDRLGDETIAKQLIKWRPELKVTPFKSLSEEQHKVIDPYITTKPGAPTLEILPPGSSGNKR